MVPSTSGHVGTANHQFDSICVEPRNPADFIVLNKITINVALIWPSVALVSTTKNSAAISSRVKNGCTNQFKML